MSTDLNSPNSPGYATSDRPVAMPSKTALTLNMTHDNASGYESSSEGDATTPGVVPYSAHPSIMAVHGSVPNSPLLHGVKPFIPGPKSARRGDTWEAFSPRVVKDDVPAPLKEEEEDVRLAEETDELVEQVKKPNYRVIGIDFDDVMCQNVKALCLEHNNVFGTDITIEDMQTYVYFQNRGWGKPADVARKMLKLTNILPKTEPVPDFAQALRHLHALGHPLHIVTSRPESDRQAVTDWLAAQGITIGFRDEDIIAAAWFTNTYGAVNPELPDKGDTASAIEREEEFNEKLREMYRGMGTKKGPSGKLKVLRAINAALFIDDHHGNLEPIIHADPPIPCLLFGPWPWNKMRSGTSSPIELLSYEERLEAGTPLMPQDIPMVEGLHRTKTWEDVIRWVREWDEVESEM